MSLGYGGHAHLVLQDDTLVIYSYCSYNINLPDSAGFKTIEDGELYIDRDAFVEPEIHEKIKRMPSGRKRLVTKRIPQDVPVEELLTAGRIKVKNSGGTWKTTDTGTDVMAFRTLYKLFREYQETGTVPTYTSWFC